MPDHGTMLFYIEDPRLEKSRCHTLSDFIKSVLSFLRIKIVHFTPNLVLMLAVFVHLCEAYVIHYPNWEVFQHFYMLKMMMLLMAGCVNFHLRT